MKYSIEENAHGWLVTGDGWPLEALGRFPTGCRWCVGLAASLKRCLDVPVIAAIARDEEAALAWEAEHQAWLDSEIRCPHERWWKGMDAGLSSRAIFAAIWAERRDLHERSGLPAFLESDGHVPLDAADLGRCVRMLDLFPSWREQLGLVSQRFPRWSGYVGRWGEVEAAYRSDDREAARRILIQLAAGRNGE
jgi:hypothetical protein